jgi:hypothetical protein
MNSFEINKILESFDGNRNIFEGVFASDKLPRKRLRKTPSAFIVNLSPSNEIGSHWISIYIDENKHGYYFDSYGLQPNVDDIVKFLEIQCKSYHWSTREIQATNSTVCGAYAVCYIIFRMQSNNNRIRDFQDFFCGNPFINDLCIQRTLEQIKKRIFFM